MLMANDNAYAEEDPHFEDFIGSVNAGPKSEELYALISSQRRQYRNRTERRYDSGKR
uniref:Uncharacterized protein n=1 Tax=Salmonella sp. TaxID=599 RepID=A0A482ETH2_SALSP|nr:hypothetical protein NNIBIDOC_00189 [Salmonella sp.]